MVDERAVRGFAAAEHYDAHRPGYPPEAVDFIRSYAALTEHSTVVELGAGSGLMTRLLPPVGRLVAVEPLPGMREVLRSRVPEAEVVEATAEETGLSPRIADLVIAAQAFHWFANPLAFAEIARLLKPTGKLALVWNVRDSSDRFMEDLYGVLAPHRQGSPGHDDGAWRTPFEQESGQLELLSHMVFPWEESIALGHLKGRVLSASYVALLGETARSAVLTRLEELVGSADDDVPVRMKHRTEVYMAGRRRNRAPRALKVGPDPHSS